DFLNTRFEVHHFLLGLVDKPQTSTILNQIYNQVWLLEVVRMNYAPRNAIHYRELLNGYEIVCRLILERDMRGTSEAMYALILNDAKPLIPVLDLVQHRD
ncbi:MAG: hypothetical protein KJ043_14380, partial [Anaerolineae bacterium]|nr:hypothetical protein [Anaerolineae bacterium]